MKKYFYILIALFILLLPVLASAESGSPVAITYFWNDTTGEWVKAQVDNNGYLIVNVSSSCDIVFEDSRYADKVSTGTAGKIFATGNIAVTNWSMDNYTFYSVGGDTTITSTWKGGTMYALEGIPIAPMRLSIPVVNPTFQCVLPAETTLYYILDGVGQ